MTGQRLCPADERPRCLFLMEDHPLSADAPGGGPATMRHHFDVLGGCGLEMVLVILVSPLGSHGLDRFIASQPSEWSAVVERCARVQILRLARAEGGTARARRIGGALVRPVSYLTSHLHRDSIAAVADAIAAHAPDLIWAENVTAAALAVEAGGGRPVVYSHHDWIWRVWTLSSRHKGPTWRSSFVCRTMRRAEKALVQRVRGVVSASATEADGLRRWSRHAAYVPPVYEPASPHIRRPVDSRARVVHVGGMTTPSNRIGLERFLDIAWPIVSGVSERPNLWVIGSLQDAPAPLLLKLERAGSVRTGFVERLGDVLRPYDVHIVPWEHDTGTRMKMPLALNHAQAVVAMRETARCLPELEHGRNCLLADSLEEMGAIVRRLLHDPERRRALGDAGRATFLAHYTHAASLPRIARFLNELGLAARPTAVGMVAAT